MNNNINDIYKDLKNLVEKTHKIIVLDEKTIKESNETRNKQENIKVKIQENIKLKVKENTKQTIKTEIKKEIIEKKTQSCQTTTTKTTHPENHVYVSLPPAGRKGTKTDKSIINWSHSLRGYYF